MQQVFQLIFPARETRAATVIRLQRLPVLAKGFLIGDLSIANALPEVVLYRDGQPLWALCRFDLIAILHTVLAELNRIKIDEYISRHYFVHIRWPGKILWLVNGNLHGVCGAVRAKSLT